MIKGSIPDRELRGDLRTYGTHRAYDRERYSALYQPNKYRKEMLKYYSELFRLPLYYVVNEAIDLYDQMLFEILRTGENPALIDRNRMIGIFRSGLLVKTDSIEPLRLKMGALEDRLNALERSSSLTPDELFRCRTMNLTADIVYDRKAMLNALESDRNGFTIRRMVTEVLGLEYNENTKNAVRKKLDAMAADGLVELDTIEVGKSNFAKLYKINRFIRGDENDL